MRAGYYRPMYYHALRAGLDAGGKLVAWQHRIVGQSILAGTPFEGAMVKNGIDATSVEGASNLPYDIPNMLVELHSPKIGVPVQWWRSVGSTHTAFSTETFIDELAAAAGKDPVEFRRALLAKHPRHLGVLEPRRRKSGLGQAAAERHARAASRCTSRSTPSSRRSPRWRCGRTERSASSAWCAPSIAASRSTPT